MASSGSSFSFVGKLCKRLAHWIGERTGNTMADDGHALFELLFPGQQFTADKAGVLAERLRGEAARLERLYMITVNTSNTVNTVNTANTTTTRGDRGGHVQAEGLEGFDSKASSRKSKKNKKGCSAEKIGLDFSRYQRRNVALQIAYRGFDYQGFARSEHAERTIEAELFAAMEKTRLVPEGVGWRELGYSRGGRTDKGVSGAGQVVALELRSKALAGGDPVEEGDEYDYCQMINSAMSENVRVIGWKTIGSEFSSRFSARSRRYKYYFVRRRGEFDLGAMREAAGHLVGEHDYRSFCKADIPTVRNFVRRIMSADVVQMEEGGVLGYEMYELNIVGTAFLWHQIRCIAAVLEMVGEGMERPEVVRDMLDLEKVPCKPQFKMAAPEPLLLYDCSYDELDGQWIRPASALQCFGREIECEVRMLLTKAQVLLKTRERAFDGEAGLGDGAGEGGWADGWRRAYCSSRHIPLLERKREPHIEERLARHGLSVASRGLAS